MFLHEKEHAQPAAQAPYQKKEPREGSKSRQCLRAARDRPVHFAGQTKEARRLVVQEVNANRRKPAHAGAGAGETRMIVNRLTDAAGAISDGQRHREQGQQQQGGQAGCRRAARQPARQARQYRAGAKCREEFTFPTVQFGRAIAFLMGLAGLCLLAWEGCRELVTLLNASARGDSLAIARTVDHSLSAIVDRARRETELTPEPYLAAVQGDAGGGQPDELQEAHTKPQQPAAPQQPGRTLFQLSERHLPAWYRIQVFRRNRDFSSNVQCLTDRAGVIGVPFA